MKKAKTASILIIGILSILVVSACNSMKSPTTVKSPTNKIIEKSTSSKTVKIDPTVAMETFYSKTLKTLVTAKKITQKQSDKVIVALTNNISQNAGTANQSSAKTHAGTGTTPRTFPTKQTETVNETPVTDNGLTPLVTNGVITQEQANMINQKIQEDMTKTK
ncbi:MAG TPA: hypothetical protein VIM70_05625 [Clostridium sp.]|uniref:hypothetical protein n=1 Tax=Clostridium sp. TaxID=1506 RepID=UPI002F92F655